MHYTVTPIVSRNVFAISLTITPTVRGGFEVYLPTWIAGSYMLRDFARHIVSIHALDVRGRPVSLTPTSQSSWHVATNHTVTLHYEVYAHDTSVRTAFLDGSGGFFNGTSLFLSAKHLDKTPHRVTLHAPAKHKKWSVATTLTRHGHTRARQFGEYTAANYDELIDHPVRMGELTWLDFQAHGTPHAVAISGSVPYLDHARLKSDLQVICDAQIALFEPDSHRAPFAQYLFIVDARSEGYGGLEHRASTALLCRRDDLPQLIDATKPRSDAYLTFLGLCSHEYFHAWNVKRIKPASFVEYDLSRVIDTDLLWFFEGITSYYDDLILLRTELLNETQYFKKIEHTLNAVLRADGHRTQSLVESGRYAWTKYYQTSPNTPNAVVSYYAKGSLVALALDLHIRTASKQCSSLDDVMRDVWFEFGRDFDEKYPLGTARGIVFDDITRIAEQHAKGSRALLELATQSTGETDFKALFAAHNMSLSKPRATVAQLGASVKKVDGGYQVQRISNRSAAQQAGLAPDDVLIAFNGFKLKQTPDECLARIELGTEVNVHFMREDVLQQSIFTNQAAPHGVYELKRALAKN